MKFPCPDISNSEPRGENVDTKGQIWQRASVRRIVSENLSASSSPRESQEFGSAEDASYKKQNIFAGKGGETNQKEEKKLRRPIAPNLLYYSE